MLLPQEQPLLNQIKSNPRSIPNNPPSASPDYLTGTIKMKIQIWCEIGGICKIGTG